MNRIMLDLETLSTQPNAAIISIGAVRFDDQKVLETFSENIELWSSLDADLHIDPDTVQFWRQRPEETQRAVFNNPKPLYNTLIKLSDWLGDVDEIWGNGAGFDNVILRNAYQTLGLSAPWGYQADRCFRTMTKVYNIVPPVIHGLTPHVAVDDARWQAEMLLHIEARFGLRQDK